MSNISITSSSTEGKFSITVNTGLDKFTVTSYGKHNLGLFVNSLDHILCRIKENYTENQLDIFKPVKTIIEIESN
jgi:hypothetical protein